jgi:hypothetical protein
MHKCSLGLLKFPIYECESSISLLKQMPRRFELIFPRFVKIKRLFEQMPCWSVQMPSQFAQIPCQNA